ncbi:MAG: pyruvate, water dikinase regulatory protein [Pseudobdellovibrionaceae bacterium]|jgi:regulator of PEP synthase PpsR (kinase-PPPase family)
MSTSTIYIISDGTGETAATMIRAALVQYSDQEIQIVRCKNIRTEDQVLPLIDEAADRRAMVVYTVVSAQLRSKIFERASSRGIPAIDLMGPVLNTLDKFFGGSHEAPKAGLLRAVDEQYFRRIEAIEYTVKNDDGKTLQELDKADIILVGISRTSKTPLSIFLSHKGWKVANIPMVLHTPLPEQLFKVDQRKIVGLMIDMDSLQRIRKNRLEKFGQDPGGEYASLANIQKEIEYAHEVFKQNRKWPVFNVTDRALEETAAEIVRIVAARMGWPESALF